MSVADRLTQSIVSVWMREVARPSLRDIKLALDRRDIGKAVRVAESLSFEPARALQSLVVAELEVAYVEGQIGYSDATVEPPNQTPFHVTNAAAQFVGMLTERGAQGVRTRALQIIQQAEQELSDRTVLLAEEKASTRLNKAVATGGRAIVATGAQLSTTRVMSLGALVQASRLGHETYQVQEHIEDPDLDGVCRGMHGMEFAVDKGLDIYTRMLSESDPASLKTAFPWARSSKSGLASLSSMSTAELQEGGLGGPPYHPYCRGMLVQAGTVPASQRVSFSQLAGTEEELEESDLLLA